MYQTQLQAGLEAVEQRFRASSPRSADLFERALRSLPGGNTRTTVYATPYPFYVDHSAGYSVVDVDGNARVDFINNYSSLILGHAHPQVVAAVQRQVPLGMSVAAPTVLEVELAEELKRRLPSIERLRFTNSGTEATLLALRAARAFTGRGKIAKFDVGYHGSHDYAAAPDTTGQTTATTPDGIPLEVARTVVTLPYNDRAGVERIITAHQHELAALIVEPVIGAGGILIPQEGFLHFLREITQRFGIVLIFDEIIAFRLSYHGAQGYFGVTPDLTTLGKIIGGGLPVGAFGGKAEIMELFDPRRSNAIGHGGTFNASPVVMAGGLATLRELTPEAYNRLNNMGAALKTKLDALFASFKLPAQVNQIGSLFNIHFSDKPVNDYTSAAASDKQLMRALYLAMLNHGVILTPRGMGCLSTPMMDAQIDQFVEAIHLGLHDLGAH